MKRIIIIIGVSGSGKSTVGGKLSGMLELPFFDADDYHPDENIAKMSAGIALNDMDRESWLHQLNDLLKGQDNSRGCVLACSALKEKYRKKLSKGLEKQITWIYLKGNYNLIRQRIENRSNHFMPVELLKDQFETLEEPTYALELDCAVPVPELLDQIMEVMTPKSEIGVFGMGVMGKNLSRNLAQKGFRISIFNREVAGKEEGVAMEHKNSFPELADAQAFNKIQSFIKSLELPRKIILMVNAGKVLDTVITQISPILSEGDILIDGGNSNYIRTIDRMKSLNANRINFLGVGISGGEEGALIGPSIMPGGSRDVYGKVKKYFESIAALDKNGQPCCTYIGDEGSGHFVKMVHNGIEYAEMQLLAEIFWIFHAMGYRPSDIADMLESWQKESSSYLLDITVSILRKKEGDDWLINKILDQAQNKGTGNWATVAAANLGYPATMIASALFARYISYYKTERSILAELYTSNPKDHTQKISIEDLKDAYDFARIVNHAQGFSILFKASESYSWNLNLSEIARIWTSGCIIKSGLMEKLTRILSDEEIILKHAELVEEIRKKRSGIKRVIIRCINEDIPIPCLSEALQFFNSISSEKLPANLIQAQRDYFGGHRYVRNDENTATLHHTDWKKN